MYIIYATWSVAENACLVCGHHIHKHKYVIVHLHTHSFLYLTRPEIDPETMCSEPSMQTAQARAESDPETRPPGKHAGREKSASKWVRAPGARTPASWYRDAASWYSVQADLR